MKQFFKYALLLAFLYFCWIRLAHVIPASSNIAVSSGVPVVVDTDESKYRTDVYNDNRVRLLNGDFVSLENAAQQLRASRAIYFHGIWALTSFYDGVSYIPDGTPDSECEDFLNKIRAWIAARPYSVTARIALADALTNYAWKARGTGWANTVSSEANFLFEDRLRQAQQVLDEAKTLPQKCPEWWEAEQTVALGLGMDKNAYLAMVNQAIAFEPTFMSFYSNAVYFLQPRWYGDPGDSENFIETQADRIGGVNGDILYARCVWNLDLLRLDGNMFKAHPKLSWSRTANGFAALLEQFPSSLSVKSEFACLAAQAGDRARAKDLFTQIGLNMDRRVWFGDTKYFLSARSWALQ